MYVSLVEEGLLGIALDVLAAVLSMCKRVYDQGGGTQYFGMSSIVLLICRLSLVLYASL